MDKKAKKKELLLQRTRAFEAYVQTQHIIRILQKEENECAALVNKLDDEIEKLSTNK